MSSGQLQSASVAARYVGCRVSQSSRIFRSSGLSVCAHQAGKTRKNNVAGRKSRLKAIFRRVGRMMILGVVFGHSDISKVFGLTVKTSDLTSLRRLFAKLLVKSQPEVSAAEVGNSAATHLTPQSARRSVPRVPEYCARHNTPQAHSQSSQSHTDPNNSRSQSARRSPRPA